MNSRRISRGFSLVELLVVIAVITLLSAVVLSALSAARVRARDSARLANAHQLTLALEQYETSVGTYRVKNAGYQNTGGGFVAKSGVTDYVNSITGTLSSLGHFSSQNLIDPLYGDNNYYLGQCTSTNAYNIYLKVEQDTLAQAPSTIASGCDGTNAAALGFNYIAGGSGAGSAMAAAITQGSGVFDLFGNAIFSGIDGVSAQSASAGQVAYYTDATHISGSNSLIWDTLAQRLDVGGGLRAGDSTLVTSCGAGQVNGEGTQRYNYTSHVMEYCNGTTWVPAGQAAPVVFAMYGQQTAQSMTHGVAAVVNFDTKIYDSHNAVTTGSAWKFTAPMSGLYRVTGMIGTANYNWGNALASIWFNVTKNGGDYRRLSNMYPVTSGNAGVETGGSAIVPCNAGDTISTSLTIYRGTPTILSGSGFDTYISIERVSGLP
jgi:prepilin-type N-terminal cleavage/methylation domain-containing protein